MAFTWLQFPSKYLWYQSGEFFQKLLEFLEKSTVYPGLEGHFLNFRMFQISRTASPAFIKSDQLDPGKKYRFDGLVQERHNSSALAMELRFSYTYPLNWRSLSSLQLHPYHCAIIRHVGGLVPPKCHKFSELWGQNSRQQRLSMLMFDPHMKLIWFSKSAAPGSKPWP